ncbi:hypothetical protein HBI56_000870 [Parastagonospora nodorum]|nr:hypothetical protein HBH53_095350 [Parastagonospora nodorum]KAH4041540.1 hypothetical protein HBI09_001190 [Parastagonospora nodorum]KAH4166227.1 hypothetical protein HBH43_138330 [Parastagonospora nodorum]KAH4188606.1 hypothetical protein HBH42_148090 [Parastagonospora nodorum]KAH4208308.1 hypothetical protein HBI95_102420 [Parastagonospora nodorum]
MPYFTEIASKAGYALLTAPLVVLQAPWAFSNSTDDDHIVFFSRPMLTLRNFHSLLKPCTGKTLLVAHWPGDSTSAALIASLKKLLPKRDFATHGVTEAFIFDVYGLPDLSGELGIDFVPCLMWYMDGVQDAVVWHQGCMVEGESVEKGISRVVERLKGSYEVGADMEGSDSDW